MHFYTLSGHEPSSAAADDWEWTSKPFHPILREGQRLSFSVRINPTINRTESTPGDTGTRRRHRRRDIVYESLRAQRATVARPANRAEIAQECGESWLHDRLLRNGFELGDTAGQGKSVICNAYRQHRIKKKNNAITISTLDCEGTGTVIDPQAFEALLPRGLGPAKGFGCGLMLIRPA
jgi:CRISPR system Cascade subunit CasE